MRVASRQAMIVMVGLLATSISSRADVCLWKTVPVKAATVTVYWENKPFANGEVHFFRMVRDKSQGLRRTTLAATLHTDARGTMSLHGVPNGNYFLKIQSVEGYHEMVPLKLKVTRSGAIRVSLRHQSMCGPYFEIAEEEQP